MRSNSKKFVTKSLIIFIKKNDYPHARLGFAISKKVGKAYIRNIFKRVVREGFRNSVELRSKSYDILIVGKSSKPSRNTKESLVTLKQDISFSFSNFSSQLDKL